MLYFGQTYILLDLVHRGLEGLALFLLQLRSLRFAIRHNVYEKGRKTVLAFWRFSFTLSQPETLSHQ